jgi:hypothetical protein
LVFSFASLVAFVLVFRMLTFEVGGVE